MDSTWWATVFGSALGGFCGVIASMLLLAAIGKVFGLDEERDIYGCGGPD